MGEIHNNIINLVTSNERNQQNSRSAGKSSEDDRRRDDKNLYRDGRVGPNYGTTRDEEGDTEIEQRGLNALENPETVWYSYLKTRDFWLVLTLGQILAICITASNTFSTLLVLTGTSIPTFQTLFNYIALFVIYTTYTIHKYGAVKYIRLLLDNGWKYAILSFLDVEGNYFTILAYRYTNLLSIQLINFWAIVCVVIVSFIFLRVRYRLTQLSGIFLCCSGMGILLISDHLTGADSGNSPTKLKGDLFGIIGATFYGLSNVFEEWFVSKRPIYEVLGMLGLFGIFINGATAAIFDRHSFAISVWNAKSAGYIAGSTLSLTTFYSLAPLILRMASAVFFDISLLTSNFWGVIIGVELFGYTIYYLYPVAFILIVLGLMVYFLSGSILGDSQKPWLGKHQENGVVGVCTARRKAIKEGQKKGILTHSGPG